MRKYISQLKGEASNFSPAMRRTFILICALPTLAMVPLLSLILDYGVHLQAEIHLLSFAMKFARGADRIDVVETGQRLFQFNDPLLTLAVCTSVAFLLGTVAMYLFVRKSGSKKVSPSPIAA